VRHPARIPLLMLAAASLVSGVWGGLVRMQTTFVLPVDHAAWITFHGPLMVSGFLGTLIGVERAVALAKRWAYAVPLVTGLGGANLLVLSDGGLGPELVTAGSVGYLAVTLAMVRRHPAIFTVLPAAGAVAWVVGNALWAAGGDVPHSALWWGAFLVTTIVGERLELARMKRPTRHERPLVLVAIAVFAAGVAASPWADALGPRIAGAGMLLLAAWLLAFDITRRTVRQPGLPRFSAVCLMAGYVWLGVAGGILAAGAELVSSLPYDALLHSLFLGFAFSMIFGHAPIVLPAVLGVSLPFRRVFYVHVVLLHASVAARVGADLAGSAVGRSYAGAVAATAIGLFLLSSLLVALRAQSAGS